MDLRKALFRVNNSFISLKLKEFNHRVSYKKVHYATNIALEQYKKCKDKKPWNQIQKEISLCKKFWGCYPLHYFRYELYKKDRQLTEETLLNYIPEFFFYRLFLRHYDSNKYSVLLSEKCVTEQLFKGLTIKQPDTLSKLIGGKLYSRDMKDISFDELRNEMNDKPCKKVFIKPVDGEGGKGIYAFSRNAAGEYINKDNVILTEGLLYEISQNRNYIIQPGIEQLPELAAIYPHSVNTFRITTCNSNGNVRVLCAVLRMGRMGCEVDNSSRGGVFVSIDINTGQLHKYAYTEFFHCYEAHPDTHFRFADYKIPHWDDVILFALASAKKLSQFTYLGWDIALTSKGPLAIEANMFFGLDIYQLAIGGLRKTFNIEDPNYYWKNTDKIPM